MTTTSRNRTLRYFAAATLLVFAAACGGEDEEPTPQFAGDFPLDGELGELVEKPLNLVNDSAFPREFEFIVIPDWLTVDPISGTLPANGLVEATLSAQCGEEPEVTEHELVYAVTSPDGSGSSLRVNVILTCEEAEVDLEE